MKIVILTLFPEFFSSFFDNSIIKRALSKRAFSYELVNIRDFSDDKHKRVDYPPIGGGAGLVLAYPPIKRALDSVKVENSHTILLSPRGEAYNQKIAISLTKVQQINIICGHYEGIDERVYSLCNQVISLGDYIMTGGEIGAIAIVDSVVRLLDGAISKESLEEESFSSGLLEYPQFVEPYAVDELKVPLLLYSGNHSAIKKWRTKQSLLLTKKHRPDLFNLYPLSKSERKFLNEEDGAKWEVEAIEKGKKFTNKD